MAQARRTPKADPKKAGAEAPVLERRDDADGAKFKRSIYALPVNVDVVIGTARPTVMDLLAFEEGSLLPLDRELDDPVDLCVDGRIIAKGELVETNGPDGTPDGGIGVKIIQIVDVSEDQLG